MPIYGSNGRERELHRTFSAQAIRMPTLRRDSRYALEWKAEIGRKWPSVVALSPGTKASVDGKTLGFTEATAVLSLRSPT
jgi:hypothetical protein